MYTCVQDLGRPGFAHLGVPTGGAADTLSLRIGNRLVGNPDSAAAIEMTMVGGTFEFEREVMVAITGGLTSPQLLAPAGSAVRPLSPWRRERVHPGERLRIGPITRGVRAYLCIAGGVTVPSIMASSSTHAAAGFGGFGGRALRVEDRIEVGHSDATDIKPVLSESATRWIEDYFQRGRATREIVDAMLNDAVAKAMIETAQICEEQGLSAHFKIFEAHYRQDQSYESLASQFGIDPTRAAIMALTAKRKFQAALRDAFIQEGADPDRLEEMMGGLLGGSGVTPRRRTCVLRAIEGGHAKLFDSIAQNAFWDGEFMVSNQSNRVGVRLEPLPDPSPLVIKSTVKGRLVSEGMMHGGVQMPPNGEPIILGADHPTTGGYPLIACVATADLPLLGQFRPRDVIRFERITLEDARERHRLLVERLEKEVPSA